jgi:peptidyl-prolyl cis-trans isomerase A (cyclophilin A)
MRNVRPLVRFDTALGSFWVELRPDAAPITTANFLRYLLEDRFEGRVSFYRVVEPENQPDNDVKIDVIQGGFGMGDHPRRLEPIAHETTAQSGLRHLDGTLSMGRLEPGTASSEFFLCIGDQPELDFGGRRNPDGQGFAAFGQTVRGLDVLRAIHAQPHEAQHLTPPVPIHRIALESSGLES